MGKGQVAVLIILGWALFFIGAYLGFQERFISGSICLLTSVTALIYSSQLAKKLSEDDKQ